MKIERAIKKDIQEHFTKSKKGIIVLGPRQAGKTTLVNDILTESGWKTAIVNGDQSGEWRNVLESRDIDKMKLWLSNYEALFVDEAQRIPEIGLSLKIILDEIPRLKVIVTGSSSLDLQSKVSEPLTGRVYTYKLYPISQLELSRKITTAERMTQLEQRLIFGSYPEVFSLEGAQDIAEYLQNVTDNYLYKDLLEFDGIKNSNKIRDLLKLLAFQIGGQVSINELAGNLGLSRDTVDRYIDLLEKSYVVFRLSGFSRNLRKEVSKMDKIFFYDLGIRNAIIGNLSFLAERNDVGQLWENFLIVERMKKKAYQREYQSQYFWRLKSGAELDYIEEAGGKLQGFEFKWGKNASRSIKQFGEYYPNSVAEIINRDNWLKFVGE
ncbi:ATP-binding protein [Candidatus Shapirobacteria bacterium]|nr:ATP-binding protein [Candidatus Shapirobacteria bacterium]